MDRQTVRLVTRTRSAISFTSTEDVLIRRRELVQLTAEESDDLFRTAAVVADRPPMNPISTTPCSAGAPTGVATIVFDLLRDFWRRIEAKVAGGGGGRRSTYAGCLLVMLCAAQAAAQVQYEAKFLEHRLSDATPVGPHVVTTPSGALGFTGGSFGGVTFAGSVTVAASPETVTVASIDPATRRVVLAPPIQLTYTINFTSTLPKLATGTPDVFQKYTTTLSGKVELGNSQICSIPMQERTGLEAGTYTFTATMSCAAPALFSNDANRTPLPASFDASAFASFRYVARAEFGNTFSPSVAVGTSYRLTQQSEVVSSISPAYSSSIQGLATDPLEVTITGKGFRPGATVQIGRLTASDVVVASETKITAKLSGLIGQQDGLYSVTVNNSDGTSGVGRDLFAITSILPRIEINQGVPMACAIRPCIADHDTWVRVKLTTQWVIPHRGKPVTGRLHVTRNGATIEGSPFRPQPATMRLPLDDEIQIAPALSRGEEALNFRFGELENLSEGTYDFRLEIDPRDPTVAPSGIADREKFLTRELKGQPFQRSHPGSRFRLSFIIDQTATQARVRPVDPFGLVEFMRAAFPISRDLVEVRLSSASLGYGQFEDFDSALRAVIKRAAVEPLASRVKTYSVLVTSDGKLDAAGSSVTCSGIACQTWGNAVIIKDEGLADSQGVLAHEIGHHLLLGDTYLSFEDPGSEQRGPHNPVSADCLSLANGCPVDSGNLDTLLGTLSVRIQPADVTPFLKRDFMGNAKRENRWIDTRTWDYLYARFNSGSSSNSIGIAAEETFIEIGGTIGQNDAVTFDALLGTPLDDSNPNSGAYSAELQAAGGQVLASQSFNISFKLPHRTTTLTAAPFRLALPYSSTAARVVIRKGSVEIGSRAISKNAPTVNITFPNGGETIGATANVTWQGSDADGDALTYSVLYSPDGSNWSALVTDLNATTYRWDTAVSAGSRAAKIMVVANDGSNQASDTSDAAFTVGGKAPTVAFTYPPDGFVAAIGQPVRFEAMAHDLEDGPLPATGLSFSSSLQGALGGGESITVANLALGTHTIALTATDKEGNRSTSAIRVTIFNPAAETRYIPAVGSTPGAGGSFFKTAVQIHNPTAAAIAGKFVYHPQGQIGTAADPSLPYMLLPQQTIAFEDFLPHLGQSGLGSSDLVATHGAPPVSVVRIFNDAGEAGTTGMTEELFRESDALKAGESGVLIAPIDPNKARYNIGIRTLGSGATMNITLKNSLGTLRTFTTQQYGPTYFVQVSAAALLGMAPAASDTIVFDILSGSALIYGASADNLTQDPSLQIARTIAFYAGSGRRVLPVVGSAVGSLGSFFRTSVQLHNAGTSTITGSLRFHPAGRSGSDGDPSMPYTLGPGATFSTPDVLQSMGQAGLGSMDIIPNGSSVPVSVVRIYNDAGVAGTSGLTEEQMTNADALAAGQKGVLLTPPDPTKSRFNIGIRTLDAGASLTITLYSATGEVRKTITPVFGPHYFQQTPAAQLLGETILANETITVVVEAGSAIMYGSSTDNKTQDASLQIAKRQ